jgi:hypothetical protein
MLLPFVHCAIVAVSFSIYCLLNVDNRDSLYIKNNYPQIWKKLHPWGDLSRNNISDLAYIKGKYDDGSDEELNNIKSNRRVTTQVILRTFLLVPVSWMINIIVIILRDRYLAH